MPSFLPDIAMSAPEPFHQTSFALSLMLVSQGEGSDTPGSNWGPHQQ